MEHSTISRRYRVDRRIGEGGMAEVFLGHDLLLNRAVAIKALRPQFAKDATFLLRFEREAMAVAGFIHPNIIDIYDVGEEQGTPYIVMEYVEGETLKEIIEHEAPFSPDDVAALLEQVGAALDYAHERGLVHRDIKPQNILVDPHGLAKVVDFGIAIGVTDSQLTEVGTGIGTVHYISPEQANGLMATPASDIYSLGVVAYEMLTGELPFDADSAVAIALSHVQDEPVKPSTINPTLQATIDSIVLRALNKDPTRRFSTAGSFAHAISEWPSYQAISRNSPPALRRSSHVSAPPISVKKDHRHSAARSPVDGVGCWTWLIGSIGLVVIVAAIVLATRYTSLLDDITASGDVTPPGSTTTQTTPAAAAGSATFGVFVPFEPTTLQTQVEVPDLRGLSLDEATNLVNSRGLLLNQGQPVFSDSVPAGAVAEQAPPSGSRLEQGLVVSVSPSNGSATVDLASLGLVGMGVEEALQQLTSRGLTVANEEVGSPDVAAGNIVAYVPSGSVVVGETVTLLVSVGDQLRVPIEILGRPVDQVMAELQGLGLVLLDPRGVDRDTVSARVDMDVEEIVDRDVIEVQRDERAVDFGAWVPRGSRIALVFYDRSLDQP